MPAKVAVPNQAIFDRDTGADNARTGWEEISNFVVGYCGVSAGRALTEGVKSSADHQMPVKPSPVRFISTGPSSLLSITMREAIFFLYHSMQTSSRLLTKFEP
jgi:hypothetical protein